MSTMSYVALTGSLGTGSKHISLDRGVTRGIAFIGSDSGSTGGGPYYLGTGSWIWSDAAYERDPSKDAGPFMLTLDLFFDGADAYNSFMDANLFTAGRIAELYGVAPQDVQIYEIPDIAAIKISFPRPVASGDFGDTDITRTAIRFDRRHDRLARHEAVSVAGHAGT